jgi:PAS domain S-box-containing protein
MQKWMHVFAIIIGVIVSVLTLNSFIFSYTPIFSLAILLLVIPLIKKKTSFFLFLTGALLTTIFCGIHHPNALLYFIPGVAAFVIISWKLLIDTEAIEKQRAFNINLRKDLFENAGEAIFLVDFYSDKIKDCNSKACEFCDETKSEIIGKTKAWLIYDHVSDGKLMEVKKTLGLHGEFSEQLAFKFGNKEKIAQTNIAPIAVANKKFYLIRINEIKYVDSNQNDETVGRFKLDKILESVDFLLYSSKIDEAGVPRLDFVSDYVERIIGIGRKEYITKASDGSLLELCHPDDIIYLKQKAAELRATKRPVEQQYRFYHPLKKKYIWLEEKVIPQFNANGTYVGNMGITRDISSRKQIELALKETESNLDLLINSLDDVIFNLATGEDGFTLAYNSPRIAEQLKLDEEKAKDFLKKNNYKLILHEEDVEDYEFLWETFKRTKRPISLNYRILTDNKDVIWLEENLYPNLDSEGILHGVFGIIRNVTEQKITENSLKLSKEKYQRLIDNNMAGVYRSNERGKFLEVNKKMAEFFEYDLDEFMQVNSRELYVNDQDRKDYLNRLIEEGFVKNYRIKLKTKSGNIITTLVNSSSYTKNGERIIEGTLIDITELQSIQQRLEENERFKNTLLSNLPGVVYRCKVDESWTMVYLSEGIELLTGYKVDELIDNNKKCYNDIIRSDFQSPPDDLLKKENVGKSFVYNYPIITKGGEEKWIWEQTKLVQNKESGDLELEGFIFDITERKKRENELKRQHQEYERFLNESPFGIVLHREGKIVYVNEAAMEITGYGNKEKILGTRLMDFVHDDYKEEARKRKELLLKGEKLPWTEVKFIKADGTETFAETRSTLIDYDGANTIQLVFTDVTTKRKLISEQERADLAEKLNQTLEKEISERQKIQEELTENQNFIRNLMDSSRDMIIASNLEGKITEWNKSAQEKFGYEFSDLNELNSKNLFASEKEGQVIFGTLQKTGFFDGEVKNINKKGEVFISTLSATTIKDENGNIIGYMGISRDITEMKNVELMLSTQRSMLRSIFESNSNIFVWITNGDLNISSYNSAVDEFFRLVSKAHIEKGRGLLDFFGQVLDTEYLKEAENAYNQALKGTSKQIELKFYDRRGEVFWLEVFLTPVVMENGDIKEVASVAHEISDKKTAESKLKDSLKEKELLLKEVHHRVKNNLQVISSILNLQSNYVEDENTLTILRESQNRIKSMSFIHESLYQTNTLSNIDFSEYMINLVKNLVHSYQMYDQDINFTYNVKDVELNLDQAIPCGLIVNELVSNALKYAFKGTEKPELILGLEELDENTVKILVSDNGIGLPENFKIEESNTLGLQLVQTLVEQVDGELKIENIDGVKYLITFVKRK